MSKTGFGDNFILIIKLGKIIKPIEREKYIIILFCVNILSVQTKRVFNFWGQ